MKYVGRQEKNIGFQLVVHKFDKFSYSFWSHLTHIITTEATETQYSGWLPAANHLGDKKWETVEFGAPDNRTNRTI